jgi:hypothetical protein
VRREKDIGRLEIAVHDRFAVQRAQAGQHAQCDGHGLGDRHGAARQTRRERLPLQQFHREEHFAVVLPELVQLAEFG